MLVIVACFDGNLIADVGYAGVHLGWTWGRFPNHTAHNLIEANHIHHVMRDLADAAGIYSLGPQEGTVYRENWIHDVVRPAGAIGAPVACFLSGEDMFVEEFPKRYRERALDQLRPAAAEVDCCARIVAKVFGRRMSREGGVANYAVTDDRVRARAFGGEERDRPAEAEPGERDLVAAAVLP